MTEITATQRSLTDHPDLNPKSSTNLPTYNLLNVVNWLAGAFCFSSILNCSRDVFSSLNDLNYSNSATMLSSWICVLQHIIALRCYQLQSAYTVLTGGKFVASFTEFKFRTYNSAAWPPLCSPTVPQAFNVHEHQQQVSFCDRQHRTPCVCF